MIKNIITKKPSKQRKRVYTAKLHENQNAMAAHLSAELRKKYKKRSVTVRKGDVAVVMSGSHKKTKAKITKVNLSKKFVNLENISVKRKDGGESAVKFNPSKLMIVELNADDEKRFKQKV